jgi:hypothetical protein
MLITMPENMSDDNKERFILQKLCCPQHQKKTAWECFVA